MYTPTSLVVSSPQQKAQERTKFMLLVLDKLRADQIELDFSDMTQKLLVHVIRSKKLDQSDPAAMQLAQAIVIVTVNLGLEYATGGDIEKAARILVKNPVEKIFLIGERLVQELIERAGKVLVADEVHFRTAELKDRYFGITDAVTRKKIQEWSEGRITEDVRLPPASIAEIQPVIDTLDRVEREINLAGKIDWKRLLTGTGVSSFATFYFLREKKGQTKASGGVFKPLMQSMMINAVTEGWERTLSAARRYEDVAEEQQAFVDARTLMEFVDLVLNNYDGLNDKFAKAADRIIAAATKPGVRNKSIFAKACSEEEVNQLLAMANDLLQVFGQEARTFCLGVKSAQAPSLEEVDKFWRSRLFLYDAGVPKSVDKRLREENVSTDVPWTAVYKVRNLDELNAALGGFRTWPEEEQLRFVDEFNFEACFSQRLCRPHSANEKNDRAQAALELFQIFRGTGEQINYTRSLEKWKINWADKKDLFFEMIDFADAKDFESVLRQIAGQINWTTVSLMQLSRMSWSMTERYLTIAFMVAKKTLTDEDWSKILSIEFTCAAHAIVVFNQMTPVQRRTHLLEFNALHISTMMDKWTVEQVRDFFEPYFQEIENDFDRCQSFRAWYKGYPPYRHHFGGLFIMEARKEVERLLKHYFKKHKFDYW